MCPCEPEEYKWLRSHHKQMQIVALTVCAVILQVMKSDVCSDSIVNIWRVYMGCYGNDVNVSTTPRDFLRQQLRVAVSVESCDF